MDTSLDLSRWRDVPNGVGYRRWVIVSTGLRQLLRLRFFQILLVIGWVSGLAIAALGFMFSQLVATGGWAERAAAEIGPRAEALVATFTGFVALYPDICIRGLFTTIFWAHSYTALTLSLLALTVLIPRLIARDRASNAFTVYFSRPLTSGDYLLGKLGIITGVLLLTWTGPLLFGWLIGMLFAPDHDFLVYSFLPLQRALLFNAISLVTLAAIALGVSALARSSRATIVIWIGLWVIMGVAAAPPHVTPWLKRLSFTHDLGEVRQKILPLDDALTDAGTKLPLMNRQFANNLTRVGQQAESNDLGGALAGLGFFVVASSFVFLRKLRPE
jgi:hypothetical protein